MTERYIAIMPYAWGEGATVAQAKTRAKRNKPSFVKSDEVQVWKVGPTAEVTGHGDIAWTAGDSKPVRVS